MLGNPQTPRPSSSVSIGRVDTLNVIMHSNIVPYKLPFNTMQSSPINVEVRGQVLFLPFRNADHRNI
jgi:hypothetical protein